MSTETTTLAPGTFCWADLSTTDTDAARIFYATLFGWQGNDMPEASYTMFTHNGKMAAGMSPVRDKGIPPSWLSHVQVEDARATAGKAASLGGTILQDATEVMGMGTMAVIQDPTGAVLSLWQPKNPSSDVAYNTPGNLCWNELITTDVDRSIAFYTGVFGWTTRVDPAMAPYTIFEVKGRGNAGLMAIPENMPAPRSAWIPYFTVTDTDATAAKAKELGATICCPPTDIPTVGRFSVIADPQGATFAVVALLTPDKA